jgi:thiol:disulfide interchange protein
VAALALAATLLALVLWGFVPGFLRRGDGGRAAPVGGFLLGALTVFSALAWNLPPLSRALGAALATGRGTALAVCLALGLGLALPYLAAAAAPGLLRRLPRPSQRWVQGSGFLAAAGALWLLLLLSRQLTAEGLAYVELALLGVGLAAWLASAARRRRWSAAWAAVLLLLSVATVWLAADHRQDGGAHAARSAPEAGATEPFTAAGTAD